MNSGHSLTEETLEKNQVHGVNHKFDFRNTQMVESKVPLRCLKRAVISNLLGTHI